MKFFLLLLIGLVLGQDERIDERGPRFCGSPENKVEEMSAKTNFFNQLYDTIFEKFSLRNYDENV